MSEDDLVKIKAGDTVHHNPSGQDWVVAYADYESDELAPLGWPPGIARICDCGLIGSCSDEKSLETIYQCAGIRSNVHDQRKWKSLEELYRRDLAFKCRCCGNIELNASSIRTCEERHRASREYLFAISEMGKKKSDEE